MSYPKTREEWWGIVDQEQAGLRRLVRNFHPATGEEESRRFRITAAEAEVACQAVREEIVAGTVEEPLTRFNRLLVTRNPELSVLLSETWFGLPESVDIRAEPSFGVLCDLCSESYLLYEEEGEQCF